MEWKIGEIKQIKGEWYQCIKGDCCRNCDFYDKFKDDICFLINNCSLSHRSDKTPVIFKKLERVGKPYTTSNDKVMQNHLIEAEVSKYPKDIFILTNYGQRIIAIEIKQNQEDMDGKTNLYEKQTPLQKLMEIYCDGRMDYNEFEKKVKELYSDKGDDSKPILKPFDIQKVREGKPVYTRDGRKARIICFDTKGDPCPIIALVEENGIEAAYHYDKNGQNAYNKSELDLMMLSKKKEGWVNVYKDSVYDTKDDALIGRSKSIGYIDTIKIEWEE